MYQEDTAWRSSYTAFLPEPDEQPEFKVVRCIEQRAAEFQGYIPLWNMEDLQVVRYHNPTELTLIGDTRKANNIVNTTIGSTTIIPTLRNMATAFPPSSSTSSPTVPAATPSSPASRVLSNPTSATPSNVSTKMALRPKQSKSNPGLELQSSGIIWMARVSDSGIRYMRDYRLRMGQKLG